MFRTARIRLTLLYITVIVTISLCFSGFIYESQVKEISRFEETQRFRLERRFPINPTIPFIDHQLIEDIKDRLLFNLIVINIGIFISAGALGYFVAGKTLKPIKEMVDEQNRFVSDASHELRTPLAAAKTSLEVALRSPKMSTAEAKQVLKDNLMDIIRLEKLSNNLLTLLSIKEAAKKFEKVEMSSVIEDALSQVKPFIETKSIKIIKKVTPVTILGSEDRLTEMFVNLIENAIKYSPNGKSIKIKSKEVKDNVYISVIDFGPGIPQEQISHLFDRFYRADSSRSTNGFGLGLSIVQEIAKSHHGSVKVNSIVGKGSSFTIILPIAKSSV